MSDDKPERRESISVEEALAVTITLFKECQAERDRYRTALERISGRPMSYETAKRIADEAIVAASSGETPQSGSDGEALKESK